MQTEPASSEATNPSAAPKLIGGRYEVVGLMGRGGMGAVYRVHDRQSDREYALKQLTRGGAQADQAKALFEREFCTLAQLRHPRIIEVHDYGLDERGPFFTMELLEGADVRDVSPLPWQTACRYLREVATSLALLHVRRLVHRDVTPRNVRMTPDGHCKLFDFGALTEVGQSGSVVGTPPCIPPEALDGKPLDARLDLYALGCLGYYMLTGKHAFPATDSRQLRTYWAREL
ncbi:MAG TPA: serine/threonine-protein kinase, partial [Polyangiales bacterium]|nr:serine/threonine-protein kinase [Polyangiales bacterium]